MNQSACASVYAQASARQHARHGIDRHGILVSHKAEYAISSRGRPPD